MNLVGKIKVMLVGTKPKYNRVFYMENAPKTTQGLLRKPALKAGDVWFRTSDRRGAGWDGKKWFDISS